MLHSSRQIARKQRVGFCSLIGNRLLPLVTGGCLFGLYVSRIPSDGFKIPAVMNGVNRLDRDRLSVLSGALLLGLALARFLETPVRTMGTNAFGSPLGFNLSATTLMLLISVGMGITAAESLIRSHPIAKNGKLSRSTMFWIIPGTLMLGLSSWLGTIENLGLWTAGVLAGAVLVPVTLATEYAIVDLEQRQSARMIWLQLLLIHLVAAIIFLRLYDLQARSLLSGTAIMLVATLLATRLFWLFLDRPWQAFRYGAPAGLLLGILTWAVNNLPVTSLQGGLIMLVLFYLVVGLIQQKITGGFGRRVVLEYMGLGILFTLGVMLGAS